MIKAKLKVKDKNGKKVEEIKPRSRKLVDSSNAYKKQKDMDKKRKRNKNRNQRHARWGHQNRARDK